MIIEIPKQHFEVYFKDLEGVFNHEKATKACEELGEGWRLPTTKELLEMNDYKKELGLKDYYWSSTENISNYAWNFNFYNGYSDYFSKNKTFRVRPIRTIFILSSK